MDVEAELVTNCSPERLFTEVEDLATYPEWLSIVRGATPAEPHADDAGPAWHVELRGRLGPLARSKRLRMVRTEHRSPEHCRFERAEHDGRDHSPWRLDVTVRTDGDDESRLVMHLHYGGRFGGGLLERMLNDEIEASRPALLERVRTPEPS